MQKTKKPPTQKKVKGLFDHLNHIRMVQDPNYFDTLDEGDKKSWDSYMICKFLSMQQDIVELVNEIQQYQTLEPKYFYKLCISIVPKQKAFFPFVKSSKKYPKKILEILTLYFQDCSRNVREYLDFIPAEEVVFIIKKYGYSDKEIEKLFKKED